MFRTGEVLGAAWRDFKGRWQPFVGATFLIAAIEAALHALGLELSDAIARRRPAPEALGGALVEVAAQATLCYLSLGLTGMSLTAVRGGSPTLGQLFAYGHRYVDGVLAWFLCLALCQVGLALFIVPGVLAAIATALVVPVIVERDVDPFAAIRISYDLSRGSGWSLFLLGLAAGGLLLVGALTCCVGLLAVWPVLHLALARVYVLLSERSEPAPGAPTAPDPGGGSAARSGGSP